MVTKGIILMSAWVLIGIVTIIGFASIVLAQVPGTEDVVREAAKQGWEAGVIAASVLAIVASVLAGIGYVGVRLFGKHDGIITSETAKVRLRWVEYITKMESYHLKQSELCKIHADTMVDIVVQCKMSKNSQMCMCAVLEDLVVTQLAQHDSEGFFQSTVDDREDFATGLMALADNNPDAVKRAMEKIRARKKKATEHRQNIKKRLEKSIKEKLKEEK